MENKEYEKKYFFYFSIKIKAEGQNIYILGLTKWRGSKEPIKTRIRKGTIKVRHNVQIKTTKN